MHRTKRTASQGATESGEPTLRRGALTEPHGSMVGRYSSREGHCPLGCSRSPTDGDLVSSRGYGASLYVVDCSFESHVALARLRSRKAPGQRVMPRPVGLHAEAGASAACNEVAAEPSAAGKARPSPNRVPLRLRWESKRRLGARNGERFHRMQRGRTWDHLVHEASGTLTASPVVIGLRAGP